MDDGKGLGGKGRLTDSKIDVLQNYYGLAVREDLYDVDQMVKNIEASLFHVASTKTICISISVQMEKIVGVVIKGMKAHSSTKIGIPQYIVDY